MSRPIFLLRDKRGVSSVEYALLLVAILIISAVGWRMLGKEVRAKAECAATLADNCTKGGTAAASNGGSTGDKSGGTDDPGSNAPGAPGNITANFALAANTGPSFADQVRGQEPLPIDGQFAQLAADVYHDGNGQPVAGFTRLDNSQLEAAGINPASLNDPSSGFKAAVYTDGNGHYVVAYKGSQNGQDWKTNFQQGLGFDTAQYNEAVALAKDAKAAFGDNMVIVGHSLGGGLASTAAAATGTPAVIFNPAGVNDKTLERNHIDPATARAAAENGQIRRYEVNGEILSGLQEHAPSKWAMPDALGHKIALPDPHPLSFWQKLNPKNDIQHSIDLHQMNSVNDSLNKYPPWASGSPPTGPVPSPSPGPSPSPPR